MPNDDRTKIIYSRTPESAAMLANVKRAMAITATLNCLTFNDADEIRALFSELIGKKVDKSFLLISPFYTAGGDEIRIGHNVFVNQNCTFYDLGGLDIADDVMIGPNVSIITTGHPLEPSNADGSDRSIIGGITVDVRRHVRRGQLPIYRVVYIRCYWSAGMSGLHQTSEKSTGWRSTQCERTRSLRD